MQTVPSLIGAGTAVAAAATGLVFGHLADGQLPPSPKSSKRKSTPEHEISNAFTYSRPVTRQSNAPIPPSDEAAQAFARQFPPSNPNNNNTNNTTPRIPRRSSHAQITPPKATAVRHSLARQGDLGTTTTITEDSRDSFSSNGSWMRRLSVRPRSQHESLRSSVGPDSPSIFSFGSGAPILSQPGESPPHLPPNKLVKRTSDTGFLIRRGSKTQMTLRRPATSHQRSATLHQQITDEVVPPLPKFSFDYQGRPRAQTTVNRPALVPLTSSAELPTWKSFWHSRVSRIGVKTTPLRNSEAGAAPSSKRICVDAQNRPRAYLVAPGSIMTSQAPPAPPELPQEASSRTDTEDSPQTSNKSALFPEETPSKQPRRSISMHFSSPTSWMTKTGSIRRRKRGETAGGNKRNVSAPITSDTDSSQILEGPDREDGTKSTDVSHVESELTAIFRPPNRQHNSSSPLPPLSRLSSFHVDLNRVGSSSGPQASPDETRTNHAISTRVDSNGSQTRTLERASTVGSSEYHRGFATFDDDDTDVKTDTPFDSFRTVASGRRRTLDSPLESMFDESPPSTAGNSTKPKRLSIQEILGPSFDGGSKIMEEDEGLSTPVRATFGNIDGEENSKFHTPSHDIHFAGDYGRLSLDDDDDLDWSRVDDMDIINHLSPPSSMNSRRGSPNLRVALGNISGNGNPNVRSDSASERPRSTVFDWTEPRAHDKNDGGGLMHRPKTVHGKQELDARGGRSASRKGPTPTHVRSQSVPAVPDQNETAKSTPKFGTWGLGHKNVSEDWDDDFEFEEELDFEPAVGKKNDNRYSMVVPASIQATQPTVKAHSGQIRELSLLVNDLKRLCRLGREMEMLNGSSAKLWREAEGIIALASPDEDSVDDAAASKDKGDKKASPVRSPVLEQGFDGASLDNPEVIQAQRHVVVRDRTPGRRRSVFSPEDDVFGTWDQPGEDTTEPRPRTPGNPAIDNGLRSSSVARSVMEAMQLRYAEPDEDNDEDEPSNVKLNFDTNSLKELVKRASDLRDGLSDLVRRADHITQSPARTPKHTRADGSPAFTRVFDEPSSSPTRRVPHSRSSNSVLSSQSVGASPSNGLSQRMQMMTVS
ncbi:hypothetical protein F4778DRAFT_535518 [Xylariomycetidae sp. FL2044]|nr:hypothetical protein F4778DRAFT_535518 [Xylariomycetidae sp. FL2044]